MILIILPIAGAAWIGLGTLVVLVCQMAARGDESPRHEGELDQAAMCRTVLWSLGLQEGSSIDAWAAAAASADPEPQAGRPGEQLAPTP